MSVTKMSLVNIVGPIDRFDDVVRQCIVGREFCPENVLGVMPSLGALTPFTAACPDAALLTQTEEVLALLGIEPAYQPFDGQEETESAAYLTELAEQYQALDQEETELRQLIEEDEQVVNQLENIRGVDCDLDALFNLRFTKLRFGRMPRDIYDGFSQSIELDPDLYFFVAGQSREYVYGLSLSPRSRSGKTDAKLSSLHFERVRISGRAHGTPEQALRRMLEEENTSERRVGELEEEKRKLAGDNRERLLKLYSRLRYQFDTYSLRQYAAHTKDTFYLCGWVPADGMDSFHESFHAFSDLVYVVEEPEELPGLPPPTKLTNRGPFRFFEQFVKMYGLPAYNELDPTPLLALTYTLFFGVMFGDVGQGIILILGGLLAYKWLKMPIGRIVSVIGCSSVVFGFIYGSVFGNEDILPGFKAFESVDNTNKILMVAIALGVLFISVAMVYNIVNGLRQKNLGKALFSQNGVAGFVFYWAIVVGILSTLVLNVQLFNPVYVLLLIVLPLLLIFFQQPLGKLAQGKRDWKPRRMGEYVMESFFEVFEILLSFLANTISFVRVGAFALNHIGMMLVVFALAHSVGSVGSIPVFIIGNVFVICLEGLIVGIQVLRLEFYELFGRFYAGDGRAYKPFQVRYSKKQS